MNPALPSPRPGRPGSLLSLAAPALLAVLFALAGPQGLDRWAFDRAAVAAGQAWRLASGHLVHCDASHLGWNLAGLLVLGLLFYPHLGRRLLAALVAGALAVDAWLWWLSGLDRYCGLSGALNGILAAGLLAWWREDRSWPVPVVAALCLAKIAVESAVGAALFTETAWPAAPLAHAAGFAGGLAGEALAGRRGKFPNILKPIRASRMPDAATRSHDPA